MKKTRAKKFKVRMFYHLQNLFWGFLSGGFWLGVFCRGAYVRGVCPDTRINMSLTPQQPFCNTIPCLKPCRKNHEIVNFYVSCNKIETRRPRQEIILEQQLLIIVHVRARYGRMIDFSLNNSDNNFKTHQSYFFGTT